MSLTITDHLLKPTSYLADRFPKKQIFIHHTAGAHNPIYVISGWDVDNRGRVATAYVIGGKSTQGDDRHDGKVYRAFDEHCWAYHLGLDRSALDKSSVGIEICNFGFLKKAGDKYLTYIASEMPSGQVTQLAAPFRDYTYYHTYTTNQIESLRLLLQELSLKFNINLKLGLQAWIKKQSLIMPEGLRTVRQKQQWLRDNGFHGADGKSIVVDGVNGANTKYALSLIGKSAFELNQACLRGAPGLWTHTNVRPDKNDCFPQKELQEMILGL